MIRFYGGNGTLLGIQIIAVLFVFGWTFVTFTPFCLCLKFMNMLHMDPLEEEVGLDICCHKGPAYRTHEVKEGAKDDLSQRRNSGSS
jgi:ammonia channel protein AmtB